MKVYQLSRKEIRVKLKEMIASFPENHRSKQVFFLSSVYMNHFTEPYYMGHKILFLRSLEKNSIFASQIRNIWIGSSKRLK